MTPTLRQLAEDAQSERQLQADNHARALILFDQALERGPDAPTWAPCLTNPLRDVPLHEVIASQADTRAVAELLIAAHKGADVRLLAGLILSNVRAAHAVDCEAVEL